jgi:hypothetical protein
LRTDFANVMKDNMDSFFFEAPHAYLSVWLFL